MSPHCTARGGKFSVETYAPRAKGKASKTVRPPDRRGGVGWGDCISPFSTSERWGRRNAPATCRPCNTVWCFELRLVRFLFFKGVNSPEAGYGRCEDRQESSKGHEVLLQAKDSYDPSLIGPKLTNVLPEDVVKQHAVSLFYLLRRSDAAASTATAKQTRFCLLMLCY